VEHLPSTAALIVIDVQMGFDDARWGKRNNVDAEAQLAVLLAAWRERRQPIFHVQHFSLVVGSVFEKHHPGSAFKPMVAPLAGEPVVSKHVNSAFIGTTLEGQLRASGIHDLVIAGLTTDHCVSTSVRMAANLNFTVWCVSDATATFERTGISGVHYSAEEVHDVSLASLNGEFATVIDTAQILAALKDTKGSLV
jgi:nicotinamidase-related amidase